METFKFKRQTLKQIFFIIEAVRRRSQLETTQEVHGNKLIILRQQKSLMAACNCPDTEKDCPPSNINNQISQW